MSTQIIPMRQLFAETWTQYKQRALPILAVVLISSVVIGSLVMITVLCGMFGGALLTHVMDRMTGLYITIALVSVLLLGVTIVILWCQAALLAIVVDEETGIIEAFQTGWEYLWPFAWVITILSGILMTGFAFGFLPGFLFLVWFSFCAFILFEDDQRGMDSLLLSREYVRGYGWNIFGKMTVIWLLSVIAALVPFLGQFLSMLLTPFGLLYLLILYRNLKSIQGEIEIPSSDGTRIFWWIITIIGLLLPVAVLVALLVFLASGGIQDMTQGLDGVHGIPM